MSDQMQKMFQRWTERRELLGRVNVAIEKRERGFGLVFELSNEEDVTATTLTQLLETIGTHMQRVHDDAVIGKVAWVPDLPSENGEQGWQPPPIVRRRKYTEGDTNV